MKLTRTIVLGIAFLMPSVATLARAEDKPAAAPAETAPAEGEKKAKKKKAKKEEKKEEAPAAAPAETAAPEKK